MIGVRISPMTILKGFSSRQRETAMTSSGEGGRGMGILPRGSRALR